MFKISKTTTGIKLTSATIEFDPEVRSQCNTLVLGSIGFGKSMLMLSLIMNDLRKRQPLCLIDLHGKLFRLVKNYCAYKAYSDRRIIIVDPSEGKYVKPYNPFLRREGVERSVQAGGLVDAVMCGVGHETERGVFVNIEKLLTVLFNIMIEFELVLLQGLELLTNRNKMKVAVAELKDSSIEYLWANLMSIGSTEWARHISPTVTRIYNILSSTSMKRFLSQVDNNLELTFEDTILVNAGKGGRLDHHAASVFAALLLNDLYQSSFRRKGKYGKDPAPYYVYVDEWWLMRSEGGGDYKKIMFECRKQGLLLVLANHDLHQLRQGFGADFAESIHTSTQIKMILGGITNTDVGRLSRELQVPPDMISSLEKQQCIIKVLQEPAELIKVPDVRVPHVSESYMAKWELQNAKKTGALSIEDIDSRPVINDNKPKPPHNNGWAIQ